MMSAMDPHTQERVYMSLKAEYRAGLLEPGRRLDLQQLADRHQASKTPLREAACRLLGERLFERHPDGGFMVAVLSRENANQLNRLNMVVASGAIGLISAEELNRGAARLPTDPQLVTPLAVANLAAGLFQALARASGNPELVSASINVNDRLLYLRISEASASHVLQDDLVELAQSMRDGSLQAVKENISRFHRRRET